MITSEQLLNYQFSKAGMNGYKAMEVDELITSVAETVSFYEKKIRDMQGMIEALKQEENVIQTTLVSAQKLANQITEESQQKADAIIAEAQQKADAITAENEEKIAADTEKAEKAVREMIEAANQQSVAILEKAKQTAEQLASSTKQECSQQELLLASMKNEVAEFRSKILAEYKEHILAIEKLPSELQNIVIAQPVEEKAEQADDDAAGSNLVKILGEMKENESLAADAVDEVAELTAEVANSNDEEIAEEIAVEAEQAPAARFGGFNIIIDDDED